MTHFDGKHPKDPIFTRKTQKKTRKTGIKMVENTPFSQIDKILNIENSSEVG